MSTKKDNPENKKETYNSNITKDDFTALGKKGLRADSADDRLLLDRKEPVDFKGQDLDVPTGYKRNLTSTTGLYDEENKLFSQGGENKENLEAPEGSNTNKGDRY